MLCGEDGGLGVGGRGLGLGSGVWVLGFWSLGLGFGVLELGPPAKQRIECRRRALPDVSCVLKAKKRPGTLCAKQRREREREREKRVERRGGGRETEKEGERESVKNDRIRCVQNRAVNTPGCPVCKNKTGGKGCKQSCMSSETDRGSRV